MFAGKEGWFPAAYAEELPDTATSVTSAAPDVVTSSSAQLPMYSNIGDDMAAGQAESQTNANENKFATDFGAFGFEISSLSISSFLDHFLQYFSCTILLELVLVG